MIENSELRAAIDKLSPVEALAQFEHHWRLARAIHARYARAVADTDYKIDSAALHKRIRADQHAIHAEVEANIGAGAERQAAIAAVAAQRGEDPKSIEFHYRLVISRRRKRLKAMRDIRIITAVKLKGRTCRNVAGRFDLNSKTVEKIVRDHVAAARGDVHSALAKLRDDVSFYRGRPLPKAPARLVQSPLANADPREGDAVIVAEFERWRGFDKQSAALDRRTRARPRLKREALRALERALWIASRGALGIAHKIRAAAELRRNRLTHELAAAALRSAGADAARIVAGGAAPPDMAIAAELERWYEFWREASGLGRRSQARLALEAAAIAALHRALGMRSNSLASLAAKIAAVETLPSVKRVRRQIDAMIRLVREDADELAGVATPASIVIETPAVASAAAIADDAPIMQLGRAWAAADRRWADLEDQQELQPMGAAAARNELAKAERHAEDLLENFIATPSLSVVGIAAKLRACACFVDWRIVPPAETADLLHRFFAAALLDAERLAGGTDLELVELIGERAEGDPVPLVTPRTPPIRQ